MLKSNYILPSILLLAACGSEEVIVPDDGGETAEVPFALAGSSVPAMEVSRATRATSALEEQHKTFTAWGFKTLGGAPQEMMHGYTVTHYADVATRPYATVSKGWDYYDDSANQGVKYWDMDATDYRVFGVAPRTVHSVDIEAPILHTCGSHHATGVTYREVRMDNTTDVNANPTPALPLYSQMALVRPTNYKQPVTLTFDRPWARVRFIFNYPAGVDYGSLTLTDISFGPETGDKFIPVNVADGIPVHYPIGCTDCTSHTAEHHAAHIAWPNQVGYYTLLSDGAHNPVTMSEPYETKTTMNKLDEWDTQTGTKPWTSPTVTTNPIHAKVLEKWYYVLPTYDIATFYGNNGEESGDVWSFTLDKSPFAPRPYMLTVMVNGSPKKAVVPTKQLRWEANHEYTYVFTITTTGDVALTYTIDTIMPWQAGVSENAEW